MIGLIDNYQNLLDDYGEDYQENANDNIQNLLNDTVKSIQKYGGFYIGRYLVNGTEEEPTVKYNIGGSALIKGNDTITYIVSRKIKVNDNIQTSLVWGWQWDAMIIWILQTFSKKYEELAILTHSDFNSVKYWANKPTVAATTDIINNIYYLGGGENATIGADPNMGTERLGAYRGFYAGSYARAVMIIE